MLPTWVGVVSAISLVIIALAALVTAVAITAAALGVRAALKALKGYAGPAIADVRRGLSVWKFGRKLLKGKKRR
jgi:hypothetical protein